MIVGASFFLNLVMDGVTSTTGVLLPYIAETFEAGNGQVALAGSLLCGISLCVGKVHSIRSYYLVIHNVYNVVNCKWSDRSDCVRINKQIWMSGGVRGWVYQCIFSFSAVIIIRLNCFSDYGQRNSWR